MMELSLNMDTICPQVKEHNMKIVPMRDLKNTTRIEQLCSETKEPVFVTKNGYGKLVIMDIDCFERFLKVITEQDIASIQNGLDDVKNNKTHDGIEVLKQIRTKYGI